MDRLSEELATTNSKLQTLKEAKELSAKGSDGNCPVCGNSLSDSLLLSEEHLLQLQTEVDELQSRRQTLQREVGRVDGAWTTYEAQYKERMNAWTQVMSRWLAKQKAMPRSLRPRWTRRKWMRCPPDCTSWSRYRLSCTPSKWRWLISTSNCRAYLRVRRLPSNRCGAA